MEFSIKELMLPANLLSLSRIPIAIVMIFVYSNRVLFFALLVAAILTDLIDGYIARKTRPTAFGALLDPVCDKAFFGVLMLFLVFTARIELWQLLLLLSRDIFTLFLAAFFLFHPKRSLLEKSIKARWPGKIVTVAQFVALVWLFLGIGDFSIAAIGIAALSVVAMIDYSWFVKKRIS